MNEEQQKQLRAPFPPEQIGKLPRVTCSSCRDKRCDRHTKSKCDICNSWISPAHIHLDFVGHADLTDRLLSVDSEWNWEPLAFDANGLPAFDGNNGMWIRLTVCGTTRMGYGHPDGKRGGDAIKETIGDALRNAAMRFGVALDLWKKEPAHPEDRSDAPNKQPTPSTADEARAQILNVCKARRLDPKAVGRSYETTTGTSLNTETDIKAMRDFATSLREGRVQLAEEAA
ncbi:MULTISPECIES: hypothetical protein [unclassified Saccharopolyspora]|uniref:hypothetical protein n=1 Tax=unclassified Saccharopolyspora TaxID=2646250 RepID=UPI001CD43864|nr:MULTISPECIES: hypothetical protein [unclassified Saccharopolyspora]MCA1185790.1 hypothetical protein [Saccharopolyspora sp. 6T]MCA1191702.1 hypothetical protein [Saccharopolyspora sp. 6V]